VSEFPGNSNPGTPQMFRRRAGLGASMPVENHGIAARAAHASRISVVSPKNHASQALLQGNAVRMTAESYERVALPASRSKNAKKLTG
jgi:hypothetical protein